MKKEGDNHLFCFRRINRMFYSSGTESERSFKTARSCLIYTSTETRVRARVRALAVLIGQGQPPILSKTIKRPNVKSKREPYHGKKGQEIQGPTLVKLQGPNSLAYHQCLSSKLSRGPDSPTRSSGNL